MTGRVQDLFVLDGKVALVTGGSRGLGLIIARTLGQLGATVAIAARKPDELAEAAATLADEGINVSTFVADLSSPGAAAALAEGVIERYRRVDILVNNAAASWGEPAETHGLDGWRKVMAVNVDAVFQLTQEIGRRAFIPQHHGRVVNIASVGGLRGNRPDQEAYTLAYNTSKGAIVNFTRALASEWGRYAITVNALCPGFFRSKLAADLLDRMEDRISEATPLGRIAEADDFAGSIAFLCSDAASFMTGQMLVVDGGMTSC